jgi:hypothetical protein
LDAPALIDLNVSIYLASKTRWVHLEKTIRLAAVPRVGEWLKLSNDVVGDYFGWRIEAVTYRESGVIELMTDLLDDIDGRGYSFEEESEFDAYFHSYLECGWTSPRGIKPNTRYKGSNDSPQGASN